MEVETPTENILGSGAARAARWLNETIDPTPDGSRRSATTGKNSSSARLSDRHYTRHVVEVIRQVAQAAHALHEAGVIHRDIKPGNILLTPDGTHAVLMDLGLAQMLDNAEGRLTRTRQFVGTLRYASPEQVLAAANQLDHRSDKRAGGTIDGDLWKAVDWAKSQGVNVAEVPPFPIR